MIMSERDARGPEEHESVNSKQITPKQFSDKVNDIFQQELKDGVVKKPPPRG